MDHRFFLLADSLYAPRAPHCYKGHDHPYCIPPFPQPTIEQDIYYEAIFIYRAPATTAGCSWAGCVCCCCCPVRLSAAPSACVRILSPRVFSMTDWYIGSAGR